MEGQVRSNDGNRPTLLLDRDGVINRKPPEGAYVTDYADFEFLPGVLAAIRSATEAGLRIVVVTNQRAVARGILSPAALDRIHAQMCRDVETAGGRIDAVFCCPHDVDSCTCRKPKPGLLFRAARMLGFPLSRAVMVGDRFSDIQAGHAAGAATVVVLSELHEPRAQALADHVAPDLADAVRWALRIHPAGRAT